jgi:aryl-alcohol dehydrogenase-like predicted oxidoreductase
MMETSSTFGDRLVIGTAGLAGLWGSVDPEASLRTLLMAFEAGILHVDTAPAYAHAETLVGRALQAWTGPRPFVSTKAGKKRSDSPDIAILDYSPEGIRSSVESSLRLLGLEVIDLLYLHDPVAMTPDQYGPGIEEMLRLKERGLVRSLGMGGQYAPDFETHAVSGTFSHFMGFNRYNVIRQEANEHVYPKLRESDVLIWQASPLYMGLLGNKYAEYMSRRPEWIPQADFVAAASLHQACMRDGLDMTGLALNFVFRSPSVDRMVLGASRPEELSRSLEWLQDHRLASAADDLLEAGLTN